MLLRTRIGGVIMTLTYEACKRVIQNRVFDKEDLLKKMDIFLLNNRLSKEQYNELITLLDKI